MSIQLLNYTWKDQHAVSELLNVSVQTVIPLGDQFVEVELFILFLFVVLLRQQVLQEVQLHLLVLGDDYVELNDEMVLLGVGFELAFNLHLVVLGVLDSEVKHRPHADSESSEVTIYFSWELTFCKVDFYFFFPFACC